MYSEQSCPRLKIRTRVWFSRMSLMLWHLTTVPLCHCVTVSLCHCATVPLCTRYNVIESERCILPGSRLNPRSSCLTSLRASVSSNRSSHSLRTVSWRKAIYNTTLILQLASVAIKSYSNISYPLFHTIVRFYWPT